MPTTAPPEFSAAVMAAEVLKRQQTLVNAKERATQAGWREAVNRKRTEVVRARATAPKDKVTAGCICGAKPNGGGSSRAAKGAAGFFGRRNAAALEVAELELQQAEAAVVVARDGGAPGGWSPPTPPKPSTIWVKLVTNAEKALVAAERRQRLRLPMGTSDAECAAAELSLAAAVS